MSSNLRDLLKPPRWLKHNVGTIKIPSRDIELWPEKISELFVGAIIFRAEYLYAESAFDYQFAAEWLPELKLGEMASLYTISYVDEEQLYWDAESDMHRKITMKVPVAFIPAPKPDTAFEQSR